MTLCRSAAGGVLFVLVCEGIAAADERPGQQERDEANDHTIIVGVGGATELELGDGSLHPGANLMVEWDAVENWLEIEIGASALSADRGFEIPIDLLVKKPFRLTRWAEFMIGVGPEVVQVTTARRAGSALRAGCSSDGNRYARWGASIRGVGLRLRRDGMLGCARCWLTSRW